MMRHDEFDDLAALAALGANTPEDQARLETHLRDCRDCGRAADDYSGVAASLALTIDPVQPPQRVHEAIMQRIAPSASEESKVIPMRRRWAPALATAASLGLVAVLGWSVYERSRLQQEIGRREVAARQLAEQQRQLAAQNQSLARAQQELEATVKMLTAPGTSVIALSGKEAGPRASARVYLDAPGRRAFIFFNSLPALEPNQDFQLWIIRADQPQPSSAGVFKADPDGNAHLELRNLPVNTEMKALAVTIEPRGGKPQPSGPMVVMGGPA